MGQPVAIPSSVPAQDSAWIGRSMERVEDASLLSGNGRFIDDLGVRLGTLYAAFLRSPHAHADILLIDTTAAKAAPGVAAVLVGADVFAIISEMKAAGMIVLLVEQNLSGALAVSDRFYAIERSAVVLVGQSGAPNAGEELLKTIAD